MKTGPVIGLLLVACGESETVLRLAALDPAECRARCISAVTVSLDGAASEHPCGAPIELGPLLPARTHQLVITATGAYGLRAEAEIEAKSMGSELTFKLEPTVRPRISAIRFATEPQIIYGGTRLTLEASDFTPGHPTTKVRVGDLVLPILAQAEGTLEVESARNGTFVLEQCGVSSDPLAFAGRAVKQETFTIQVPNCESPRYLSASPYNNDPSRILLAYGCGTQCSETQLLELAIESPTVTTEVASVDGCPIDVAASNPNLLWVSTEAGLHVCTGPAPFSCGLRSTDGRYEELSRADEQSVAGIHLAEGANEATLRYDADPGPATPIGARSIQSVAAIDGRMALAKLGEPYAAVLQWDVPPSDPPFRSRDLTDCVAPHLIRRYRHLNAALNILVICGTDGDLRVHRLGVGLQPIASFAIDGPIPHDLLVDPSGRVLWLFSPTQLTFVNLDGESVLGSLPIPPGTPARKIGRTEGGERCFLGGSQPGELISWVRE